MKNGIIQSGTAETREAAMTELKAQWLQRREAWERWVGQ
jgi:hypothetical protein